MANRMKMPPRVQGISLSRHSHGGRPLQRDLYNLVHTPLICHHCCSMHYSPVVGGNRGLVEYSELNNGVTAIGLHFV